MVFPAYYKDIRNAFKEIYLDQKHALGEMHPNTLETKLMFEMNGWSPEIDRDAVLSACERVYDMQASILGEDHTHILYTKMYIGILLYSIGNVARSRIVMKEVHNTARNLWGESHSFALITKYLYILFTITNFFEYILYMIFFCIFVFT